MLLYYEIWVSLSMPSKREAFKGRPALDGLRTSSLTWWAVWSSGHRSGGHTVLVQASWEPGDIADICIYFPWAPTAHWGESLVGSLCSPTRCGPFLSIKLWCCALGTHTAQIYVNSCKKNQYINDNTHLFNTCKRNRHLNSKSNLSCNDISTMETKKGKTKVNCLMSHGGSKYLRYI